MTALTDWDGEIEVAIAIHRDYPAGEWDASSWDAATWDDTDTPMGNWLDVTCDTLVPINLKAGATRTDGIVTRWEAATASVGLYGDRYDPRSGPWAGKVGPGLPVRIRWRPAPSTAASVGRLGLPRDAEDWRVVFLGDVQNGGYEWDPATRTANLDCWDRTSNLVAFDQLPSDPPVGDGDWASARIHRLADTAYVPEDERDISPGGVTLLPSKLSGTVWANMLAVADTDVALLWTRRDGRLAFRPEGRVAENVDVSAVLVPCPDDAPPNPIPLPETIFTDGFEAGVGTWTSASANLTVAVDTAVIHVGARSLRTTRASTSGIFQIFAHTQTDPVKTWVSPGSVVRLSGWFRHNSGPTTTIRFTARFNLGNAGLVDVAGPVTTVAPDTWTYLEFVTVVPAGVDNVTWASSTATNLAIGQAVWVDEARIEVMPPVASKNLLTSDRWASAEDGTTTGWAAGQATLANSTAAADHGTRSIAVTPTNVGPYVQPGAFADATPVTAGKFYSFLASVRPDVAGRQCYVGLIWWNAAGAATFDWGPLVNLGAAGAWTRLRRIQTAPAGFPRVSLAISPRGMVTGGGEKALVDRLGVFEGTTTTEQWSLPSSWTLPVVDNPIGYVDLLDANATVLRNWVTIARRKLEGAGASEPAVVTRVDDASVSRFRPQTFRNVALEHVDDSWSATVADVVLADGAWPSTGPESVELDTRVHGQPAEIAAVLLGIEPEHVFNVEAVYSSTRWRMIAQGWDVEVRPEYVAGSVTLDDVTRWGTAAGWDDPAPPHGWDVDTWALSGWTGGGTPGGLPSTRVYVLESAYPIAPPGTTIQIPLIDPGTGRTAFSFSIEAGTFSFDASVLVSASTIPVAQAIRVSIAINGSEVATNTVTTAAETTVAVALPTYVASSTSVVELSVRAASSPLSVIAPTSLTIRRSA